MSKVSIVKCSDYDYDIILSSIYKTFENLGGIKKFIKPGMSVALKPNLLLKKNPAAAATTHPILVKALISVIQEAGAHAIIAESPGGPYTNSMLKSVYSECGMKQIAEETGAHLNYALDEVKVGNPAGKLLKTVNIIKPLADADLIINIPKFKTHGQMVYTGAVKNMFGAIAGVVKAEYHMRTPDYDEFANTLIDIFLCTKPALNIMDAVEGMEGYGPSAGNPRKIGLVIASENAFALDFTSLNIININPSAVPIIKNSQDRGLCPLNIEDIEIVGERLDLVKIKDFYVPQLESLRDIQFYNSRMLKILMKKLNPKPVFDYNKCVGCSVCASNCPAEIIEMVDNRPEADLKKCIHCFCCQELCPAKAITLRRPLLSRIAFKIAVFIASIIMRLRKN